MTIYPLQNKIGIFTCCLRYVVTQRCCVMLCLSDLLSRLLCRLTVGYCNIVGSLFKTRFRFVVNIPIQVFKFGILGVELQCKLLTQIPKC